jgi:hypothetical protein
MVSSADFSADSLMCKTNAFRGEEKVIRKSRCIGFLRFGEVRLTDAGNLERGKVVPCTNKTALEFSNEVCIARQPLLNFRLVLLLISPQLSPRSLIVAWS